MQSIASRPHFVVKIPALTDPSFPLVDANNHHLKGKCVDVLTKRLLAIDCKNCYGTFMPEAQVHPSSGVVAT